MPDQEPQPKPKKNARSADGRLRLRFLKWAKGADTKLVGRSTRSGDRLDDKEYARAGVAAFLDGDQVHIHGAKELEQFKVAELGDPRAVMVVHLSRFDYVVPWVE